MNNQSAGNQRFTLALGTAEGDVSTWAFGVQVFRTNGANSFYAIGKIIDTASTGLAEDVNEPITTLTANTFGDDIMVLMRVTDAGAETTTFNSRVQISLNGGNSWIYDTDTDPDLPNGWRLNAAGRHIMWDIAPNAGPVTYENFSLKLNPPASNVNTSSTFRVIQYNIHYATQDGKVNTQRIANFILDQGADLVSLNEVDGNKARSDNRFLAKELSQETGMAYVFSNNVPDMIGNAILSKYPVLYRDHRLLPNVGDNEQRGLIKATVDVNGKFVSFWSTHLDFKASDTERLMCGTNFNTWVDEETLPVIIAGDFNDTPGGAIHDLMEKKWAGHLVDRGGWNPGPHRSLPWHPRRPHRLHLEGQHRQCHPEERLCEPQHAGFGSLPGCDPVHAGLLYESRERFLFPLHRRHRPERHGCDRWTRGKFWRRRSKLEDRFAYRAYE